MPIEQIDADGNVLWMHQDQLGSVRALTDEGGRVAATQTFEAFGAPAETTGTASTPFGFAGEYTDAETGFAYLRARYYDPATAQFLTRDPLVALTQDSYGYGGSSPTNLTDPTGLLTVDVSVLAPVLCNPLLIGGAGLVLDALNNVTEGLVLRASVLGRLLRGADDPAVRSYAAKLLPGAGRLARNPLVSGLARGAGRALPVVGAGIEAVGHLANGDSVARTAAKTTGSLVFGTAGGAAGGFLCGTATVATLGLGAASCPVLVGGLGAAGAWAGGKLGEIASNLFDW
jgi:RHS repeat-associated protein